MIQIWVICCMHRIYYCKYPAMKLENWNAWNAATCTSRKLVIAQVSTTLT